MKLKTLQVQLHEQKSITKKLKIGRKNLEKENTMRSRYENPESKTIGTKKKTGNILLDPMQRIQLRGLELWTNFHNYKLHLPPGACPKGEIALNANTSIFIQIFISIP